MTILFFTRLFYPHIGGVEKHVLEVGKRLVKKGYTVTIVTEEPPMSHNTTYQKRGKSDKLAENVHGMMIYRIPMGRSEWFKKFRIWWWLLRHTELIKSADLVHCHDVFYWFLPFKILYPTKRIFTTFHGYEGNEIPGIRSYFMHRVAEKLSRGNICVGEFLKKYYKTKPTVILHGGVEKVFRYNKKTYAHSKVVQALYLGRMAEEVGIMPYLKGAKLFMENQNKIRITALGDGPQRLNAEAFCKTQNIEVDFKGFVENVDKYLQNCDVVFTSRYLGILESFSHGKYVIAAYNNQIKKDYLAMTPFADFMTIVREPGDIAKELEFVISQSEIINLKINKAYSWVKKQTWESVVSKYLLLWNEK